jgi:NNP family nitrate/nitrite transporter-like MFS transporter
VGVIGGVGGFVCPILFGILLQRTGLWTTCWMFFALVSLVCLAWLTLVVSRSRRAGA